MANSLWRFLTRKTSLFCLSRDGITSLSERTGSAVVPARSLVHDSKINYSVITMPPRLDSRQLIVGDSQERVNERMEPSRNGDPVVTVRK
jgi:hypothetical protein